MYYICTLYIFIDINIFIYYMLELNIKQIPHYFDIYLNAGVDI